MENSPAISKTVVDQSNDILSPHQPSEESHRYKYDNNGRRYHGDEKVTYLLPNDDDGTTQYV